MIGIVQVVLGIILALAAVALFIASFEAEDVKGRSYKGMIVLAIFGVGLIANGCRTFTSSEDE